MTTDESLAEIAKLLRHLPGIEATAAYRCDDGSVQVRFRCGSFDSLKAIVDCAAAANEIVEAQPSEAAYSDEPRPSNLMCFTITVKDDSRNSVPPSQSEIIGVFLTRSLRRRGLISVQEWQRLHDRWHAVPL